ncbi:alpha/beta hydrolase [Porphyromonas pogonae]|uniref:alpha/beta fold hydrolase n=1 Tax=Porphyromonas pogonae TaxID=867595 RepID=UPI002E79A87E|nr:alpha/beta hydrolase [Porphyromonas pogonae]
MKNQLRSHYRWILSLVIVSFAFITSFPALAQSIQKEQQIQFVSDAPLRLINIGDADLAVRYHKGEGIPIVFVHGSWDDHHSWIPVIEQVYSHVKNPIIVYDRRGHSASTPDIKQGSVSQDVNDVLSLMKSLDIERAHFVGHSYGANIVIQLTISNPEKVRSVVLYEPPVFGLLKDNVNYMPALKRVKEAMTSAKKMLQNGDIEKGTMEFVEKAAFGDGSWYKVFDERARCTMTANYRTWLDQSNDPERLNIHPEKLNIYKEKITVITGGNSLEVYPDVVKELKSRVPEISVKVIPGAGHGGLVSHSRQTANVIIEHLK